MVHSLSSPRSDNAQGNMVVYDAEFGIVVWVEGPYRTRLQEGLDYLGFHHPHLECTRHVWSVVDFLFLLFHTRSRRALPPNDFGYCIWDFGATAPKKHERVRLLVALS